MGGDQGYQRGQGRGLGLSGGRDRSWGGGALAIMDVQCPTPCLLPAPRPPHLATAPAGQDPLPLPRLTEHVHYLLSAALRPHGDREQQDSAGRGPEPAGTEGRPSAHLGARGAQPSLLAFALRRITPLACPPRGKDSSYAQVPAPARAPEDPSKEGAGRPFQTHPHPRTPPGAHPFSPVQSPRQGLTLP